MNWDGEVDLFRADGGWVGIYGKGWFVHVSKASAGNSIFLLQLNTLLRAHIRFSIEISNTHAFLLPHFRKKSIVSRFTLALITPNARRKSSITTGRSSLL